MSQSTAVTADHLRRLACLYVRQSSLQQVRDHPESTARQYALKRRALALGWAADRIVVIDDDLGISGASAAERTGFQRVVADVGLGRVGVVMGLEVSRLARNSSDWHRLLEICALSETLILDEDGLYDPAHFNDRLLLGLKGTMSEAELHVLRARLIGGQLNKARRGELWIRPPLGFVVDPAGKLMLDPDEQVQSAVRLVFGTFGRTGSAGAVVRYFQQQQVAWPQRVIKGLRAGVLVFGELERHRVLDILHNPRYAGAYVYGRTRQRKVCLTGQARYRRLPRDEWRVFLPDAHAGYISWEQFEANQETLRASTKKGPLRPREKGPPVGSVSTSTLLRHSETAHPAPRAGNPPSPTPIPSRRFRSGAAFGVRWRAGSLGRCGRSGRARPGRAARPITAIRAAGRAVCHPKGRSGAEDARSALTRRPSRSYAAPTSRQACRASRGRVRTEEHDPTGINGLRMPAPGSPSWPPTGSCRRRSSRHARSPWAARQPPAPTDPDRLLEQLRGRGPGEGFRQRVPPLPVLVLQRQERLHRVVPLLWPRSPVRRPAVPGPGLAGLPPLPVTRLPLRVRQRHDYSSLLRNGPVSGGSAPGRSGPTG